MDNDQYYNDNRITQQLMLAAYGENDFVHNRLITQTELIEKRDPILGFLEYLVDSVLIIDEAGNVRAANQASAELFGCQVADLVGKPCHSLFKCQAAEQPSAGDYCTCLTGTQDKNQELFIKTKTGEEREVTFSVAPLHMPFLTTPPEILRAAADASSPCTYNIIALRDISEQKRQERIEVKFIAAASHQLRSPLTSIKLSVGLALAANNANPILQKLLKNIEVSSFRMERVVSDLIELTNLQNGRVKLEPQTLAVGAIVAKAVELSQSLLQAQQQELKVSLPLPQKEPLYVKADPIRLRQVLNHLISNASKFSPAKSSIELHVTTVQPVKENANQQIIFSVKDYGIGIASEEQALVFEKFYQSQVIENAAYMGSGLGLPLAKALVELSGGKLWFESKLGKGSTFHFSLPTLVGEP